MNKVDPKILLKQLDELKRQFEIALTAQPQIQVLTPTLGEELNQLRKQQRVDLQTLSLQTEISVSTLKRIFQDPTQVKFASVMAVAQALGVQLCYVV